MSQFHHARDFCFYMKNDISRVEGESHYDENTISCFCMEIETRDANLCSALFKEIYVVIN